MDNTMTVIKAEKSMSDVNEMINIVERTQYDIFNNMFEYGENKKTLVSHKAEIKDDKGKKCFININKKLKLMLEDKTVFRELTPFDRAVHNAVCSLCYSGIESFTTDQVYRIITGNPDAKVTDKIRNMVEESIRTLRNRIVGIDFEEEGEYFGINLLTENGDEITFVSNYILPLSHTILLLKNGQKVEAWNLLSEPPLLSYARIKKQIETIAVEQLQVPLPLTENTIKLREFLLQKVLLIKRKTPKSGKLRKDYKNCNILKFEDIYDLFGFDRNDHSSKSIIQRNRLIEKCETMFNYWIKETGMVAKCVYIKDNKGKHIGFKIKVNLDKFKLKVEDIWDDEDEIQCSLVCKNSDDESNLTENNDKPDT